MIARTADAALGAVWHFEAVNHKAEGQDLVQIDLRSDAEAGVIGIVVPDGWVGPVEGSASSCRASALSARAIGRQDRADLDVVGIVVVHATADYQVTRPKEKSVTIGFGVLRNDWDGSEQNAH